MRGYSPSSRMGLGRGASAAVYLGEVLVAGRVGRTDPELPHRSAHAQKPVRPSGIYSSGTWGISSGGGSLWGQDPPPSAAGHWPPPAPAGSRRRPPPAAAGGCQPPQPAAAGCSQPPPLAAAGSRQPPPSAAVGCLRRRPPPAASRRRAVAAADRRRLSLAAASRRRPSPPSASRFLIQRK